MLFFRPTPPLPSPSTYISLLLVSLDFFLGFRIPHLAEISCFGVSTKFVPRANEVNSNWLRRSSVPRFFLDSFESNPNRCLLVWTINYSGSLHAYIVCKWAGWLFHQVRLVFSHSLTPFRIPKLIFGSRKTGEEENRAKRAPSVFFPSSSFLTTHVSRVLVSSIRISRFHQDLRSIRI